MKQQIEIVKEFMKKDWSCAEKVLFTADVLLFGILAGWLTSPFQNGFHVFSHNTLKIRKAAAGWQPENQEEEA